MKRILQPKNLPYAGAIVQAVIFSIAGSQFFPNAYFGALAGLGVGAVVSYSIALASTRISDIAEKRKPLAWVALVVMTCLSPTTITLSLALPKSIYTSIAWAMCVDLAIILAGAIAGKSMMPDSDLPKVIRKKKKVAEILPQEPEQLPKVARKRIQESDLLAYLAEHKGESQDEVAKFFGVSRQAIGARMKTIYSVKKEKVKHAS